MAVRDWLTYLGVKTLFMEPGSLWEHGYIESFNGKLRDELLSQEVFYTLAEAKILIDQWRKEYNQIRPHSAKNYCPPAPETIINYGNDVRSGTTNGGRSFIEENDMAYKIRPALTIIDIQNGFVATGGSFDKLGFDISKYQKVVPVIQDIYHKARSLGIPVFFSQALREKSGIDMIEKMHKILPSRRYERISKIPLCVRGTWDSMFVDALKPQDDDLVVQKRRDSIFQDTECELWLRSLSIDTIIFTGIDTSICVESSLRDAFNRGWDVILLSDATASLHDEFYETTIAETRENFGLVLNSKDLFKNLKRIGDNQFLLDVDFI